MVSSQILAQTLLGVYAFAFSLEKLKQKYHRYLLYDCMFGKSLCCASLRACASKFLLEDISHLFVVVQRCMHARDEPVLN